MLQIVVLGSAAGGGFPQWNCNSEACRNARAGDALARTQSSIAVSGDGRHWFLFNASPDLRQQINATPQLHPNHGLRTSPIAGVVLTNADVDHVAGLLTLRESTPLVLYATERVLATLKANSIFNALNPEFVERRPLVLGRTFEPVTPAGEKAGLAVEAFPVPGKVALYLENPDAGPNFGTQEGDTVGVKTGQRMGHMSMSGEDGTMAAFRDLHVERRVFIHINNSNPTLLDLTPERREVEAQGWEISFDGMEITL